MVESGGFGRRVFTKIPNLHNYNDPRLIGEGRFSKIHALTPLRLPLTALFFFIEVVLDFLVGKLYSAQTIWLYRGTRPF